MSDCNPSSVRSLRVHFLLRSMKTELFLKLYLNLLHKLSANLHRFPSSAMNPFLLVSHLSS